MTFSMTGQEKVTLKYRRLPKILLTIFVTSLLSMQHYRVRAQTVQLGIGKYVLV